MKRTVIISICLSLLLLGFGVLGAHEAETCDCSTNGTEPELTYGARAMLCSSCGFGSKKDNCVICGKWMGGNKVPAYLCSDCGFGSRKDNCILCGKWTGGNGVPACICSSCGFGSRKDNCAKCGKWRGGN